MGSGLWPGCWRKLAPVGKAQNMPQQWQITSSTLAKWLKPFFATETIKDTEEPRREAREQGNRE